MTDNTLRYYTIIRRVTRPTWSQAQDISAWFYTHTNNDKCGFWHPKMSIWFVTIEGIEIPNAKCCIYHTIRIPDNKQLFSTLITEQGSHYVLTSWDTEASNTGLNIWPAYMDTFKRARPTHWISTIPLTTYKQENKHQYDKNHQQHQRLDTTELQNNTPLQST